MKEPYIEQGYIDGYYKEEVSDFKQKRLFIIKVKLFLILTD